MSAPLLSFRPESGDVHVDLPQLIAGRLLITANSGGGKSRAIRYMCEQLHGQVQQIILDPEGEFATLREKYPYLLAGRDGDVPADVKAAKLLCRRVLELNTSLIVDLYDLRLQQRREYVAAFLDELMHVGKKLWRPLVVVVDEAQVFAPQNGRSVASEAVIALCTQGRKRGFAAVLATLRLSQVDKDASASLINRMIGRTGEDVDVRRAGDMLGFDRERRQTLPHLKPGEFYAFGPAIAREVTLVRTGDVVTTHPEPGKIAPPAPPAPAAVRKLLDQMKDLEREAAEELRTIEDRDREISKLRSDLRRANRAQPVAETVVDERAIARAVATAERGLRQEVAGLRTSIEKRERELGRWFGRVQSGAVKLMAELEAAPSANGDVPPAAATERISDINKSVARLPRPAPAPRAARAAPAASADGLSAPQQRILNTLAEFEALGVDRVHKSALGIFSDASPTSSAYGNNLGHLRSQRGYISYPAPGYVALTDDGRAVAQPGEPAADVSELHERWFARLSSPQAAILRALIEVYPDSIERTELAELSGASPTSSAYGNNLGFLRSQLKLIDYPDRGHVAATALLFPEGVA